MNLEIDTPEAMEDLGSRIGEHCPRGSRIYLQGELGAGKTTLVRGFLRARGYQGKVKSPTYTLVEPYELPDGDIFHFDLYRLEHPLELESIGFRDYFDEQSIVLLEWPEKAGSLLPEPELLLAIALTPAARKLEIHCNSPGTAFLSHLKQRLK